jgi:hypothetical protein
VADDKLSAALEEDREALAALRPAFELPLDEARASFAAGMLLARAEMAMDAVLAVLRRHALTALHRHTEPCDRHRYRGISERKACPDCQVVEWTGCETCRDEFGNPARPEDCRERAVILAALTGEGKPDGQ